MGKYKVLKGQNIYDVALHLHGSVEGIVDLLMSNPELSLCDKLQNGRELYYTDSFIINPDIVAYNRSHNIVPANGERNVYFKETTAQSVGALYIVSSQTMVSFDILGSGLLEIDWGDNSVIQLITLSRKKTTIHHTFDNVVVDERKVCLYGEVTVQFLDMSTIQLSGIKLGRPLPIEYLHIQNCSLSLDALPMLENSYEIVLIGIKCPSLLPLIALKSLAKLDLSNIYISQEQLDLYLLHLVLHHYERRNCHIVLTHHPSGVYQAPNMGSNNEYIIRSGMEAIWVIINEPSWNEGGYWKFTVLDKTYTKQA